MMTFPEFFCIRDLLSPDRIITTEKDFDETQFQYCHNDSIELHNQRIELQKDCFHSFSQLV